MNFTVRSNKKKYKTLIMYNKTPKFTLYFCCYHLKCRDKMKKLLLNLNTILILAFMLGFIDLSGTPYTPYNYLPGWLIVGFVYIWFSVTMYFVLGNVPVFENPKKRIIIIAGVMSFALLVGMLIIKSVG